MKLAVLLSIVAGVAAAQPSPVIKSETRIVLVDAVVTGKKGEIVSDLTAKDFHVWEDKKEQAIQSASLESSARRSTSAEAANYLTLMFDYTGMDSGSQVRARQAASSFIDANAGSEHVIAIATFDGALHIDQGFTGNAGRLKDALNSPHARAAAGNSGADGTGALADVGARDMLRSLESLARNMNAAPGRKSIVLLAGGTPIANEQKAALAAAIDACNKANVAVYAVDVRESSQPDIMTAENQPGARPNGGRMTAVGGRGGARITLGGDADPSAALDPGGASQQVLFALASGTGGFVIRDAAELPQGMQKIGQEQDAYYVLAYTPPESKEGVCHALKVKVDRGGTTVRARSSYCTGKARELLTGSAAERNLESIASKAQSGSDAGSMELPFFYVGTNTARVNVAMEISPGMVKTDAKKGNEKGHAEIEILGIASAAEGSDEGATAARFSDTLTPEAPGNDDAAAAAKAKPLHYEKEFRIAPGRYKMTVVFSSGGESAGKLEQPLVIAPYQAGDLAVSGVAFAREIHKAGESGASLFDDRTPLLAGGMQLTPTGSDVFTKPEKAYCYFEVYRSSASAAASVAVRIVDRTTGEVKWDGGAMKIEPTANGKSTVPIGLNLPTEPLAPGLYRLEISASEDDKASKRSADFELK